MASDTKILEAIFGPSIPTEKAAVLPEIMGHIRAIEDLLQGKPRQPARPRISDPAISRPINSRILALCAERGWSWPKIAAAICHEFGVTISPDACRSRYKDALERKAAAIMQQEGYAALSGQAIQAGVYTSPQEIMQIAAKDTTGSAPPGPSPSSTGNPPQGPPVEPIVDSKPGEQKDPDDRQITAIKAEAIRLYRGGMDVDSIARKLDIRSQWVPLTEAEIDSELIRLRDTGMSPKEIRDAMLHRGVDFGLAELRDRLSTLAKKSMQDRKDARQASEPEIPANCNRVELDAVMWRLWDHGKGKTPDEISDILCNNGYSYGVAMVERRLMQQGAEF